MNEKGWSERNVGALIGSEPADLFVDTPLAMRNGGTGSANGVDMFDAMMRTDYCAFLGDDVLTKVDRASMAASLECRDPVLDHRIAEFAFSLPLEYLYSNREQKRLLKHVLRRWVSESILKARKRGFVIPLYEWMRGPWRPLVQEYLSKERVRAVGILNDEVVSSEVTRFYRYEGVGAEKLQLMLNFQMWAERWYCQ
jgi:asparagine synthase (glutamine-hydrolysing)